MPQTINYDEEELYNFYNSYIELYIMRDIVDDYGIVNTENFRKFLRSCAAFSGRLINYTDIAQASNISSVTAKEWVNILQNMGIVYLLEPYYNNELKKLVKTPKMYFLDTGFCAFLSSWTSKDTLLNGAEAGHYFENYIISEIIKRTKAESKKINLNYYRDTNQNEIDLVLEYDGIITPYEIKLTSKPDKKMLKNFHLLKSSRVEVRGGGVICMVNQIEYMTNEYIAIPAFSI